VTEDGGGGRGGVNAERVRGADGNPLSPGPFSSRGNAHFPRDFVVPLAQNASLRHARDRYCGIDTN